MRGVKLISSTLLKLTLWKTFQSEIWGHYSSAKKRDMLRSVGVFSQYNVVGDTTWLGEGSPLHSVPSEQRIVKRNEINC